MIFITVGSSLPHDELIMAIDTLVHNDEITDDVEAQIGAGEYIPRTIKYVRFSNSLDSFYNRAEVVISNCGAGTILENVTAGRRLVIIQNPSVTGGHEWELASKMEDGHHLIWCKKIEDLVSCIAKAKTFNFIKFNPDRLDAAKILLRLKEL
ncbi:MAG: glycosyltransferase [Candidatus Thorarchaeota archaeon]